MKTGFLTLTLFLAVCPAEAANPPFALRDSGPASPDFQRRFLASYGVNEALEPQLTQADRPLYDSLAPFLRSDPRRAIQIVLDGLTSDSNPAFHFLLGNLYYQVGDYDASERYLRQSIDQLATFRRAHRTLALVQVQRGRFAEAIPSLLRVIELGGGDAQSYGLLAYGYLGEARYESALAAYRLARMFDPDSLDFKRGQAECLLRTHQPGAAVALFDELLADHPEEKDFWLLQANAFLALDRKADALGNLVLVADSGRANRAAFSLLGDLYLDQAIPHLALEAYLQALKQDAPDPADPPVQPLQYFLDRGLYPEARRYLEAVRAGGGMPKAESDLQPWRLAEARLELAAGDSDKARALLESALAADPLNGEVLLLLGRHFQESEEAGKAALYFERAQGLPEQEYEASLDLTRLAVEQGRLREALEHLDRARALRSGAELDRYREALRKVIDSRP